MVAPVSSPKDVIHLVVDRSSVCNQHDNELCQEVSSDYSSFLYYFH